jgi:hypothetical protein
VNTYSVVYFLPGSSSQAGPAVTVQAYDFVIEDGFITFITNQNHALFAVPVALNPVVTQTAAG